MTSLRMAQYGTKHGHALGKLLAMVMNPDVEVVGVYEPDPEQRRRIENQNLAGPLRNIRWFDSKEEMLGDPSIVAIASEGLNSESLEQTAEIVAAGKHVWYDKPAGENWSRWQEVMADAQKRGVYLQMGYMFRYHAGFQRIANWAKSGLLGELFSVRAPHVTWISPAQREVISEHRAGIFFDLGGHMLDQVVWLLGRPTRTTGFFHNHNGIVPAFSDNTLGVLEYEKAIAFVDIAAMEPRPMARRFEVYGSKGSAILLEPFEPGHAIRLCLEDADGGYRQGEQHIPISAQGRQELYDREMEAFVAVLKDKRTPDRPASHELLVQETLLRTTGHIS